MPSKRIYKNIKDSISNISNTTKPLTEIKKPEKRFTFNASYLKPLYVLLMVLICVGMLNIVSLNSVQLKAATFELKKGEIAEDVFEETVDTHFMHAAPVNYDEVLSQRMTSKARNLYTFDTASTDFFISNSSMASVASTQIGNGGYPYWNWFGCEYGTAWCAIFATYCASKAGLVKEGICPRFSAVNSGVSYFVANGQWASGRITPSAGMYIFFDYDGDGRGNHVGIVTGCEDGIIYCIEGNYNDHVAATTYPVGDYSIMGYGVPDYN